MKKIAFLFLLSGLFTACDDGDMVYENLSFDGNIQKCADKDIFYKLNGNEMLFAYLPGRINDTIPLPLNQEFTFVTNSTNNIVYRQYSDKAIPSSICDLISPSFPSVTEEFTTNLGGEIKYKRVRKINRNDNDNRVSIDYVYVFNFNYITLSNGSREMKYENYNFGEFVDSNAQLHFSFINDFIYCDAGELIVLDNNQAIKLNISGIQFPQNNSTQTINLNATNFIDYLYFQGGSISAGIVCDLATLPSSLQISENWKATQGILEVVSTANSTIENPNVITGYTHTLILKNAVFSSGDSNFTINEQVLGTYNN